MAALKSFEDLSIYSSIQQPDPQDSFDCNDAYKEYGIYSKHQRASVIENPMLSDPRSMIDPRYYKVNCLTPAEIQPQPQPISDASRRRIQFQQRWSIILYQYHPLLTKCHNHYKAPEYERSSRHWESGHSRSGTEGHSGVKNLREARELQRLPQLRNDQVFE